MVHRRIDIIPGVPVKVDVGLLGLLNDPGAPPTTVHVPVPGDALLPASVTVVSPQVAAPIWSGPAFAVGATGETVIVTFDDDGAQGLLVIVQVRT
jgi:hypothetical protein